MKRRDPEQTLPASIDCERAILGAIILDNQSYNQAASVLTASDFSYDSHRKIYSCMNELAITARPMDHVTVADELQRHKQLDEIGGVLYILGLTDGLPRVKNISQYVDIVREKARSRMLLNVAEIIQAQIREFESSDDVLADIQQRIIEILYHGRTGKSVHIKDICIEALNKLQTIRNAEGACIGLTTGLRILDEMTTGYREHEFYVIGARPGNGKTAFMCQAVRANCKAGRKASVFSLEVPKEQIIYRLACQETGISVFDTRDPRALNDSEMMTLAEAHADISQWPLLIEDSPRLTLKQISAIARLHISQGAEIIFVDFLQKMRHPARSEYDRVTAIADGLWELGRSTGIPVVALSQLKRSQEAPTMDDLRSSGEIEQNANAIFLLWRPFEIDPATEMKTFTEKDQIIIAKQRSGIAGTHIPVKFNGRVGQFEERSI